MTTLREAAQQALEALRDFDYDKRIAAITALRVALAEPTCCCGEPTTPGVVHRQDGPCYMPESVQSGWDKWQAQKRGCQVCGIGANGETVGYVCTRNDCPTRVTCGVTP